MNSDIKIIKILKPSENDIMEIRKNLQDYNRNYFEISEKSQFVFKTIDENNKLQAGLVATQVGEWMEIDYLWVDKNLRGKKIGLKLLDSVEKLAQDLRCKYLSTTTFNFQAKPFYVKYGFKVVYIKKNYPINNEKYYLEKDI